MRLEKYGRSVRSSASQRPYAKSDVSRARIFYRVCVPEKNVAPLPLLGEEVIVDAALCDAAILRDARAVRAALDEIVRVLDLRVVGDPMIHTFGGEGGVTALYLLSESHLACHTYPEHRSATLNLYSCGKKPPFRFDAYLRRVFSARVVNVTRVPRGIFEEHAREADARRERDT